MNDPRYDIEQSKEEITTISELKQYIWETYSHERTYHNFHIFNEDKDSFSLGQVFRIGREADGSMIYNFDTSFELCFTEEGLQLLFRDSEMHVFSRITPDSFQGSKFDSQSGLEFLFELIDK